MQMSIDKNWMHLTLAEVLNLLWLDVSIQDYEYGRKKFPEIEKDFRNNYAEMLKIEREKIESTISESDFKTQNKKYRDAISWWQWLNQDYFIESLTYFFETGLVPDLSYQTLRQSAQAGGIARAENWREEKGTTFEESREEITRLVKDYVGKGYSKIQACKFVANKPQINFSHSYIYKMIKIK